MMEAFIGLTGFVGMIICIICIPIRKTKGKTNKVFIVLSVLFAILFIGALNGHPTIGLIIAVIILLLLYLPNISKSKLPKSLPQTQNNFVIPRSNKKRIELAQNLKNDYETSSTLVNNSDNVRLFFLWYDDTIEILDKLCQLNEFVNFECFDPQYTTNRLNNELQWHLCDVIARERDIRIHNIENTYVNSKEFQKKEAYDFEEELKFYENRFSEGTKDFCREAIRKVNYSAGILGLKKVDKILKLNQSLSPVESELNKIDNMEGHDFEYWCADLLRKNGFTDVSVTQGSGDHSADVLAEKDGVTYAIQCKCYSSDLGNAAVQQANAGRDMYSRHVGVVMTNRYFSKQAKEEAQVMKILLWNRDIVKSMIQMSFKLPKDGPITEEEIELWETLDDE